MKQYLKPHPWHIIEKGYHPDYHEVSESIFSLGNGRFGIRGNFEELFSGKSLRGSYFAGVYYPDLTRVGWWKNGYPEYFAKVLNAVNWIGIDIRINGTPLDLAVMPVKDFIRTLDMQNGALIRSFTVIAEKGSLHFSFTRFCSMADPDIACIQLTVESNGFDGEIELTPYLDFDVHNKDSNYGDQFWENFSGKNANEQAGLKAVTKKTAFTVSSFMQNRIFQNNQPVNPNGISASERKASAAYKIKIAPGDQLCLEKYMVNLSSLYVSPDQQEKTGFEKLTHIIHSGYERLYQDHTEAWQKIWEEADISIDGDVSAQQGIRFNIFHLWQTYTGEDARLNIGPKGFTGEKYGGSTYWDTEAYCIPFYLSTSDPHVARNLLVYRYLHLPKAIENAQKLGFTDGAALYPMVTMNGEECHNEWEITFEEIHRNGAIVYAIYDYLRYTGDTDYLLQGGLEVMIGVARFWAQRFNYSVPKQAWVMLGVTGPNEYENNVNNNWYTNYLARWCMQYAIEQVDWATKHHGDRWKEIQTKTKWSTAERDQWKMISNNVYLPEDEKRNLFMQQDGFLDKDIIPVSELPAADRPLNQKWSWDRILRSCYIKQADVLQGFYFFEDHFDEDTLRRHFDFYEPLTVHESSLSPCVHAILASRLGKKEKANEMYLRTSRLDLDDYNNDTEDGLHITSMAGTWMSVVRGFAGLQVKEGKLHFAPDLPVGWKSFSFRLRFRGRFLQFWSDGTVSKLERLAGEPLTITLHQEERKI